jgi:hypothetical protein
MLPPIQFPVVLVSPEQSELLQAMLRAMKAALRDRDLSQEKVGQAIRMNTGSLSRHLNTEGGLTLRRLSKLDPETLACFGAHLVNELGMPRKWQQAARLAFGLVGKRRMARMDAAKQPQRRSA